jgi:CBS domain-containing protein
MMQRKIVPDIVERSAIATMKADESILEAAKIMASKNIAAMIVVDASSNITGIVTERDMTQRVLAKGIDAAETPVSSIMTANPDTLSPNDSAGDALELMQSRKYRHLPVEEDGKCVAVVSIRDLYAAVKEALEEDIRETEAFVFGDRYGA